MKNKKNISFTETNESEEISVNNEVRELGGNEELTLTKKKENRGRPSKPIAEQKTLISLRIGRDKLLTLQALARIRCLPMITILENAIIEIAKKEDTELLAKAREIIKKEEKELLKNGLRKAENKRY